MKKKVVAGSILSLAMCASVITGATFALFTSETETNISISSGKVEVVAEVTNLALYSQEDIDVSTNVGTRIDVAGNTFPNGGTADYADGTLTLDRLTPGDGVTFNISVTNNSNVAIQYRTVITDVDGGLLDALTVTVDGASYYGAVTEEWTSLAPNAVIAPMEVSIELPTTAGNEWQDKKADILVAVEAVQGNTATVDIDPTVNMLLNNGNASVNIPANTLSAGQIVKLKVKNDETDPSNVVTVDDTLLTTTDISFVDADGNEVTMPEANYTVTMDIGKNLDATKLAVYHNKTKVEPISYNASMGIVTFTTDSFSPFTAMYEGIGYIDNVEDLIAVSERATAGTTREGVEYYLTANIDLGNQAWTSIKNFAGTFDGQGHTISNLKDAALFNTISGEVKNLNLKGVTATDKTQFASFAHTVSGKVTSCNVSDVDITVTVANHGGAVAGFVQTVAEGATVDGCKVSNVTVNLTDASKNCSDGEGGVIGGVAAGATVKNCEFTNITLSAAGKIKRGGGIFGSITGKVSGCTVNGVTVSTTWSTDQAGGFAGIVNGGAEITDIILNNVNLDIVYGNNLGGLMGKVGVAGQSDITLRNITTNGLKMKVVEYTQNVGGFIGQVDYRTNDSRLTVDNCHINDLDMTLSSDSKTGESPVAGFISCINGGADITNCSVDGKIDGTNELLGIGGFLGDIGGYGAKNAYTVNITACAADVAITGNDSIMVGGFVAYAGSYRQTNTHTLNFTNCEAKVSFYGAMDSNETSNFTGCKVDGVAFNG